jgi:antitoxin ParD1/3/4
MVIFSVDRDIVRLFPIPRKAVAKSCLGDISIFDIEGAAMGTNVNLTPELERFAQAFVESGRFNNVSEVVRSGLRLLQEAEERRAAFVASLEAAREEGLRQGFVTVDEVEVDAKAAIAAVRKRRK